MRKRLRPTLIIILVSATFSLTGQNNFIGIKGGIGIAHITANEFWFNALAPEPNPGICSGLTFEHIFKQRFSVGADLIYIQKGFIANLMMGVPVSATTVNYNFDYLSIPIKLGLNYGKRINGFVNLGICPSYLIKSTSKIENSNTVNETDKVKRFDLAVIFEPGIGYKFKERFNINLSGAYQRSLISLNTTSYYDGGNFKHTVFTFCIGLQYALTNN